MGAMSHFSSLYCANKQVDREASFHLPPRKNKNVSEIAEAFHMVCLDLRKNIDIIAGHSSELYKTKTRKILEAAKKKRLKNEVGSGFMQESQFIRYRV